MHFRRFQPALLAFSTVLGASCAAAPPPPASPRSPEKPPRLVTAEEIACKKHLDDVLRMARVAQKNATEDQVERVLGYADGQVQQCAERGHLTRAEHAAVLDAMRDVIAVWYARNPVNHASSLVGDTSDIKVTTVTADGKTTSTRMESVADRRSWSEYYVRFERELQHLCGIDVNIHCPLPRDVSEARLPDLFMRVDALGGMLLNRLPQDGTVVDKRTEDDLADFAGALRMEGYLWPSVKDGVVRMRTTRGSDIRFELAVEDRFFRVSALLRDLAAAWGERSLEPLRRYLGEPYRSYVASLGVHYGDFASPRFHWVKSLSVVKADGTVERSPFLPLERIQEELLFDRGNLRALFMVLDSEEEWAGMTTPAFTPWTRTSYTKKSVEEQLKAEHYRNQFKARYDEIDGAAQRTLLALRSTEGRSARLQAISRIVMAASVRGGREVTAAGATQAEDPVAVEVHRYSSRVISELGLCLMNDALFNLTDEHVCSYPPRMIVQQDHCMAQRIVPELEVRRGVIQPIPEPTREAYARVLGVLSSTWQARDALPDVPAARVSDATACELRYLTTAANFTRLSMDATSYTTVVGLLGAGRLRLQPDVAGPLIAAAMLHAQGEADARCAAAAVSPCTAEALWGKASGPDGGDAARHHYDDYCSAVGAGSVVLSHVLRGVGGAPGTGGGKLDPLERSEVVGIGRSLAAETASCARLGGRGAAPASSSGKQAAKNR